MQTRRKKITGRPRNGNDAVQPVQSQPILSPPQSHKGHRPWILWINDTDILAKLCLACLACIVFLQMIQVTSTSSSTLSSTTLMNFYHTSKVPPNPTKPLVSVISYSVYGIRPKYVAGMIATAQMLPKYFPGWQARVYHDHTVPVAEMKQLSQLPHVTLVNVTSEFPSWVVQEVNPMVWRFLVAADPSVGVYLIRDSDSRPSFREKAAVDEWLRSGTSFHIMRDHILHDPSSFAAMLGGMWGGLQKRAAPDMMELVQEWYHVQKQYLKRKEGYGEDQEFLWKNLLPRAKDDCLQHDSHHCVKSGGIAFPLSNKEAGDEDVDSFVGAVVFPNNAAQGPEVYRKDLYKTSKPYLNCLERRRIFLEERKAKNLSTTVLPCTPFIGSMVVPTERNKDKNATKSR